MDPLNERLESVNWWIPGMREFEGTLFLFWLLALPALCAWGALALLRLWKARRAGEMGPQEYRWRSSERFRFFGELAVSGCFLVPGLFVLVTFAGLFLVTLTISDSTAWNVLVLIGVVFWFFAYRSLIRRLRAGLREPERPEFGEVGPELPFFFRRAGEHPESG